MAYRNPSPTRARRQAPSRPHLIRAVVALISAVCLAIAGLAPRAGAVEQLDPELSSFAKGVDVANWQHPGDADIDWKAAARAGKSFSFIKATEADDEANDWFGEDMSAARAAGLAVGGYHKARPAQDAAGQARAFAKALQKAGGQQLPPVLDIELDEGLAPAQLIAWTRTFLTETKKLTGRTPIVYTYRYFWLGKMANTGEFTSYPLWLAEYDQSEPTFPLIGGWTEWAFWQYAGNDGRSAGFSTAVDLNVFAGSTTDLKTWLGPVTPGASNAGNPTPPAKPKPAAKGGIGANGSSLPTKITIPKMAGVRTPPGITLPMTIELPSQLLNSGSLGGGTGDLGAILRAAQNTAILNSLPAELLKAAKFS